MTGERERRGNRGELFVPGVRRTKRELGIWPFTWGLEVLLLLLGCGEESLPRGRHHRLGGRSGRTGRERERPHGALEVLTRWYAQNCAPLWSPMDEKQRMRGDMRDL